MDGRTTDRRMDKHTDVQHETIIPRHYCVMGYKNELESASVTESSVFKSLKFYSIILRLQGIISSSEDVN